MKSWNEQWSPLYPHCSLFPQGEESRRCYRLGTRQSGCTCELGGATRLIPGGAGSAPEGGPIVEVITLYGELRALRGVAPALNARGALAGVSM